MLLIEGTRGEHAELVKALREKEIEVRVLAAPRIDGSGGVGGDPLPTDLAQLQPYDSVILGNVPKEAFTESQHQLLASNCHDMGSGLVMLGGSDSFGAGGWMNTPVEKALPVDMQIKAIKVQGIGAMALIMHASEIAEGNFWQKVVAKAAIKALSSYDYAGLLHWEGQEAWLFTLRPIGSGQTSMLRAIDRMTPGDMPDFDPSLQMAMKGLNSVPDAMSKHIVVISDGDPTPPSPRVISQLIASKITVTAVLTAAHGNDPGALQIMRNLAQKTKGRFYNVTNPKALPRIYQKEARSISRPLIFEQTTPWLPKLNYPITEPVMGIPEELPAITGLVLTSPKENELVEIPIVSPLPTGQLNPVLAHWTYGLGRSVAFTSDAGRRWAKVWPDWRSYAAFWSQVIRWSMRPADRGNLTLNVRREQGQIKVVVDALDKNNEFLNFLRIQGNVVNPDLKSSTVELVQVAPGRYEATIENAEASGNYFVNLGYRGPDKVQGVISTGVSVPYSDEYRELRSNPSSLETLASLTDGEIVPNKTTPDGRFVQSRRPLPARSQADQPPVVWGSLADPALAGRLPVPGRRRRPADRDSTSTGSSKPPSTNGKNCVAKRPRRPVITWTNSEPARPRLTSSSTAPAPLLDQRLPLPRSRMRLHRARSANRFWKGERSCDRARAAQKTQSPSLATPSPETAKQSYTDRLLKAKQRVWEEREKDKEPTRKTRLHDRASRSILGHRWNETLGINQFIERRRLLRNETRGN